MTVILSEGYVRYLGRASPARRAAVTPLTPSARTPAAPGPSSTWTWSDARPAHDPTGHSAPAPSPRSPPRPRSAAAAAA
eukprot:CAMPEP_0202923876 /NCGR_PEP_ID=MMETSP1392-20130828/78677_1 /ASSEMBLY_ACC=CAM_ASM_000868 /TAXON_ID=225041 /ORGANISM="Chlamydomonas chlamydogama, Strain SAG 11-48b" /LENGTH=78 /DNA_ID=CAMNT_0049617575 /DNA_START=1397 /DNA_END=1629 /DNA_ORIENTATION=+